jgi:hypothetical protein
MTFNFNIFQCFWNSRNHLSNFSYLVCISCKIFIRWRFYLFLKTENSRRVAESRPVCVGLKGPLTLAIFAAISSVNFYFWWMWMSRWVMNVLSMCTLIWRFTAHPLVHIHQKRKITAKIASANGPFIKHHCWDMFSIAMFPDLSCKVLFKTASHEHVLMLLLPFPTRPPSSHFHQWNPWHGQIHSQEYHLTWSVLHRGHHATLPVDLTWF